MTPTPRTNRNCQHCGAPFTALANIARLERELEEAKEASASLQRHVNLARKVANCPDDETLVVAIEQLQSQLTAAKAALVKAREALERAQTAIGAPGPASTAWNVTVTIRNALTTLNELKEAKP